MVEKSAEIPEHPHQQPPASFPLNLPLQGDVNPLGRLMEQYQRLAATETKSVAERLETVKQDKTAVENQYSQYQAYWSGHNWWEAAQQTAANWQALGYSIGDNYPAYINNPLNLLHAATTNPTVSSNSLTSRLTRISPTAASGGLASSPGASGGGKYSRGNCECPNCMEAERVGIANMPQKKRGVHNCHIRGCGKVYSKSSHLKAHLRWHDGDRNVKPRGPGAP